jgi:hypothetical protein
MMPRIRPRRTYTLDPDVVRWIEAEAKRTGFKMSTIVENAVREVRRNRTAVEMKIELGR